MLDVSITIVYVSLSMLSVGLGYLFFIEMFPEKRWESDVASILFGVLFCLASGAQARMEQEVYISTFTILIFSVLHGLILNIFYKCRYQIAFVWMWFYTVVIEVFKLPLLTIFQIERQKGNIYHGTELGMNVESIWCFCIILLISVVHKIWKRTMAADMRMMLEERREILFGFAVLGWSMLTVIVYTEQRIVSEGNLILNLIVFITLGVLFRNMYVWAKRVRRSEQEILRQQTVWLREQKAIKDGYVKDAKRLHDMKHVLLYLQKCIAEKDTKKAEEYLQIYTEEMAESQRKIWTGYSEIDFSVNYYYQMMQEKGIQFTIETDIHGVLMEDQDMMIVLGNLLDNAMTAAEKCEHGEKEVHLKLQTINEMFLMQIENSTTQMPEKKNGRFLSSKGASEYHGWGIESVKQIVKKYDGDIRFEYTNAYFQVEILIYGKADGV